MANPYLAPPSTHRCLRRLRRLRSAHREELAEFLGTFIMILIGLGVVAQTVLSADAAGGPLSIHIGWGVGVALAVYVAGGVSAHLNPAVTLAMVCFGDTPLRRLPTYALAQVLGAFSGAAVVFVHVARRCRQSKAVHDVNRLVQVGVHHAGCCLVPAANPEGRQS